MGQEFVVGGYTPGSSGFDALIVGFYKGRTCCSHLALGPGSCRLLGAMCSPRSKAIRLLSVRSPTCLNSQKVDGVKGSRPRK